MGDDKSQARCKDIMQQTNYGFDLQKHSWFRVRSVEKNGVVLLDCLKFSCQQMFNSDPARGVSSSIGVDGCLNQSGESDACHSIINLISDGIVYDIDFELSGGTG